MMMMNNSNDEACTFWEELMSFVFLLLHLQKCLVGQNYMCALHIGIPRVHTPFNPYTAHYFFTAFLKEHNFTEKI
jgi:hypothetical protein